MADAVDFSEEDVPELEFFEEGEADDTANSVPPPDDYLEENDNDANAATSAFLRDVLKYFQDGVSVDADNRTAALEDLTFVAGDQWPSEIRARRELLKKPVLTVNRLPAFVAQVVNQRRLNEATIRVHPDAGGDKAVAQIRQGIIRGIEKESKAKVAYDTAHQNQVIAGDGAFRIELDYAYDDVFDQDIKIKAIPNVLSVVWDPMSTDPTGRDAGFVFIEDRMREEAFKKMFPNAQTASFAPSTAAGTEALANGWFENNLVRVVEFWRMRESLRTLALMMDGSVEDVTDKPAEQWAPRAMTHPDTGRPYLRQALRKFAEMYVTNGVELLDGPYRLPMDRVPVFRCMGWEIYTNEKRQRFGLVRFLKDPQRLHNYWRTVIAERLQKAPKNTWLAGKSAVDGLEKSFRDAASSDDPLLVYNDESGAKPELQNPPAMDQAFLQEAGMASQDIKDISNLHEASMGMPSNEVSGRALNARQRIGELGTAIYQANLNLAIEECGRAINQLLPYVYDTVRQILIVGEDEQEDVIKVNGEGGVDIAVGKYKVTVATGPSYTTRRAEAAEGMLAFMNTMPETAAVVSDLLAEAQDWPKADEIARRLRSRLPDDLVDPDDLSEEEIAARREAAQTRQAETERAAALFDAELSMKQQQGAEFAARAAESQARAIKTIAELEPRQREILASAQSKEIKAIVDLLNALSPQDQGASNGGQ